MQPYDFHIVPKYHGPSDYQRPVPLVKAAAAANMTNSSLLDRAATMETSDVAAYVLLVMFVLWAVRPWAQRTLVLVLTMCLGPLPMPTALAAAIAIVAHRAWFSPRFFATAVGFLCAAVLALSTWTLPPSDYAWSMVVWAAAVEFQEWIPRVHTHWRVLGLGLAAALVAIAMNVAIGMFVVVYWLTRSLAAASTVTAPRVALVASLASAVLVFGLQQIAAGLGRWFFGAAVVAGTALVYVVFARHLDAIVARLEA